MTEILHNINNIPTGEHRITRDTFIDGLTLGYADKDYVGQFPLEVLAVLVLSQLVEGIENDR